MTLESTVNKNKYIGNGVATQFPFTFKIWKTDQVLVYVGDGTTEREVSRQCSVSITASGGTVTFQTPPEEDASIVIRRNMPYIQEDDYRSGTRFDSEEIEDRFDQDCAERQDLRLDVGRALKVPLTSDKTQEQYQQEFWDAYHDSQSLHADVVSMHSDMMAEQGRIADARAEAISAVESEGDYQVQRVQAAADSYYAQRGTACMEMTWTMTESVAANTDIDIDPLSYIVGRHQIHVSVNGIRHYRTKQFDEKGTDSATSHVFTTLVALHAGDTVNVWISHLAGAITASADEDGLMSKEDKAKLDGIASSTSFSRTTAVLDSDVSAGTEVAVPYHFVDQGLLLVYHNGVLCESGAGAQYIDFSTTSIKFNYDIPAGDTITAAAVAVSST